MWGGARERGTRPVRVAKTMDSSAAVGHPVSFGCGKGKAYNYSLAERWPANGADAASDGP
jgi:hypothetical protein